MASKASASASTAMCAFPHRCAPSGPPSSASVSCSPMAASTTDGPDSAIAADVTITTKCAVDACRAESP